MGLGDGSGGLDDDAAGDGLCDVLLVDWDCCGVGVGVGSVEAEG